MQNSGSPSNSLPVPEGFGKSGLSLTDAEVICTFMEPKPVVPMPPFEFWQEKPSTLGWWRLCGRTVPVGQESSGNGHLHWLPRKLTLNECHGVEAWLTDEQMSHYDRELNHAMLTTKPKPRIWYGWHASAEQKIRALAATLRSRVLPKDDAEGTQAYQEKRG